MNILREISFLADVTIYYPEQGKDYTTKREVILTIQNDTIVDIKTYPTEKE